MRRHAFAAILAGLTLLMPTGASAQATPRKFGMLAKAGVTKAAAEARKWRSDSYLFQIAASNVQDGVAMWNYDFFSPGATGKKCFRVNVAPSGEVGGAVGTCALPEESKLPDFTIDSDKAFGTARKDGLAKPALRVHLRMTPVRGAADRPIWTLSEGASKGDKNIEVDAVTGEIRSRMTGP